MLDQHHNSSGLLPPACLIVIATVLPTVLAGCSGGLPQLDVSSITPIAQPKVVGGPTEVYARLARAALACWFAPNGPLKADYTYSADAEPASRGGKAQIAVHVKDPEVPNRPSGAKVFVVRIEPEGETAHVSTENRKLQEPVAEQLTKDVARWSQGDIECTPLKGTDANAAPGGWNAKDPATAPAEPEKAKPATRKKTAKQPT